jgi:transcriptional regulator with XRE-family HTH domain
MSRTPERPRRAVARWDLPLQNTSTTGVGSHVTTCNFSIDPRRKAYLRLLGDVHTQIANAEDEERRGPRRLTRTKMAEELGCDKSTLSRKLKQTANVTLESLSAIAHALDREVVIFLVHRDMTVSVKNLMQGVSDFWITTNPGESSTCIEPPSSFEHHAVHPLYSACVFSGDNVSLSHDRHHLVEWSWQCDHPDRDRNALELEMRIDEESEPHG